MKKSIVRTLLTLGLSAVLSPVAVMAQSRIQATIPFDFTVGNKSFAAGDYRVNEMNHGVLLIQNVKDHSAVITLVMSADKSKVSNQPTLIFNRYGNSYFLSKVSGADQGWQLHRSRAEGEIIAKLATSKPVVVAAALRSK